MDLGILMEFADHHREFAAQIVVFPYGARLLFSGFLLRAHLSKQGWYLPHSGTSPEVMDGHAICVWMMQQVSESIASYATKRLMNNS